MGLNKMKLTEITERINNIREMLDSWDEKTIKAYKTMLFFVIGVDLLGIYYYLSWKRLGIAIMLVSLILLGLLLYLDQKLPPEKLIKRRKPIKMTEENQKMEEIFDEAPKEEKESNSFGFDTGLPSSEDYNKRMDAAFGTL